MASFQDLLCRIALDRREPEPARIAAVGGLTDRPQVDGTLRTLASEPNDLGAHAALALDDRTEAHPLGLDLAGLHVAQLTLVGDLDGQLSRGGTGDTGGVASLLVSASAALARHPDVAHVLTIGRGTITDVVAAELAPDEGRQVPDHWWVADRLPQVALLAHASVAVSHGGNNSVQEAPAAGVGQVLLPFSTDQFAVAADLERVDAATVADPNRATTDDLAEAIAARLDRRRPAPVTTDADAVLAAATGAPAGPARASR